MADKAPEKQADQAAAQPKKKKGLNKTMLLVVGVSVVEAIGLWGLFSVLSPTPTPAGAGEHAAQPADGHGDGMTHVMTGEDPTKALDTVEIPLLAKVRAPNDRSGRLFMYDFDLTIKVQSRNKDKVSELVEMRAGEISDKVAQIVRAAEPAVLNEPDLKTLRMQLHRTLGEIAGDHELVLEVLIPRWVPIRGD